VRNLLKTRSQKLTPYVITFTLLLSFSPKAEVSAWPSVQAEVWRGWESEARHRNRDYNHFTHYCKEIHCESVFIDDTRIWEESERNDESEWRG
jgi:hypothetical protein